MVISRDHAKIDTTKQMRISTVLVLKLSSSSTFHCESILVMFGELHSFRRTCLLVQEVVHS